MSTPRYHGRAAFDPTIVAAIAGVLRSHWDQDGALARAAEASLSEDQTLPKTYEAFATAIAGLLAAGGSEAEVSRYLRLEEERLLGASRSTGHTRWPIARFAWRAVRDLNPTIPPAVLNISPSSWQVEAICAIPDDWYGWTRPSQQKSWRELLEAAGYTALRPQLTVAHVASYLRARPTVVEQWERYSWDKRTTGGYYLWHSGNEWIVGRLRMPGADKETLLAGSSAPEVCAEYILMELDWLASIDDSGPKRQH
jgi:hypothetical protein